MIGYMGLINSFAEFIILHQFFSVYTYHIYSRMQKKIAVQISQFFLFITIKENLFFHTKFTYIVYYKTTILNSLFFLPFNQSLPDISISWNTLNYL